MPAATSSMARSSELVRSSSGGTGTVIECRSTMQMWQSSTSWATTQWRIAPIRLPMCFEPVGWMPENTRVIGAGS